jgi:hypothetical protein
MILEDHNTKSRNCKLRIAGCELRVASSPFALGLLISIALTLLIYGSSLRLPFTSDDLLQVPWVERTPVLDFWTSVGPYRDYRPLHFSLWKILALLTGNLTPPILHALNLVGHALSGTLAGVLAARWSKRPALAAALAAGSFILFPFAFDAVPWAIAFSYPLTTALATGALLAYLGARQTSAVPRHILALALTGLAGFAHEGGIVVGAIIIFAELIICRPEQGRLSPWSTAHLVASGIPFFAAALVRPQGTTLYGLAWPDALVNTATALQALVFPVAPLATPLLRGGLDPELALALVGLPALFVVGWSAARALGLHPFLLILGWWAAWSLAPILTLRSDWLHDAPRAFYPTAVGAAVLWAGAANQKRCRHALVAAVLLVAFLLPAGQFANGRMALYQQVGDLLRGVVAASEAEPSTLIVNLPSRITLPGQRYPLGHEGVIPLPREVGAADLIFAHTGRENAAFERAWGPLLPASLPYTVQPLGEPVTSTDLRDADRIYVVDYRPDGMSLLEAGAIAPVRSPEAVRAQFGDALSMVDAICHPTDAGGVTLTTRWQVIAPIEGTPTIFAHLLSPDGALLTQADGDPLQGLYPFNAWQPGEVIEDVRVFQTDPPAGASIALGVWDPTTGERWSATDAAGASLHDQVVRCAVTAP